MVVGRWGRDGGRRDKNSPSIFFLNLTKKTTPTFQRPTYGPESETFFFFFFFFFGGGGGKGGNEFKLFLLLEGGGAKVGQKTEGG